MARDNVKLSNYFWLYKVRSTVKCDFALWKDPCPQCKGLSWHLCKPRGDVQLLQVGHDSLVPRAVDLGLERLQMLGDAAHDFACAVRGVFRQKEEAGFGDGTQH